MGLSPSLNRLNVQDQQRLYRHINYPKSLVRVKFTQTASIVVNVIIALDKWNLKVLQISTTDYLQDEENLK